MGREEQKKVLKTGTKTEVAQAGVGPVKKDAGVWKRS